VITRLVNTPKPLISTLNDMKADSASKAIKNYREVVA
jgi:hypothetical protein